MERDPLISMTFNLTYQALIANDELGDKTPNKEKYSMPEIQDIVATIMIAKQKSGLLQVAPPEIEAPPGYDQPAQSQTGAPAPPSGGYNPPWPEFNGQQLKLPPGWDGTETLGKNTKYPGQAWSTLKYTSVKAYRDKNDDTKYHNKAQWEMDRRVRDNVEEPASEDDGLPF